jgi:hypothetical protein
MCAPSSAFPLILNLLCNISILEYVNCLLSSNNGYMVEDKEYATRKQDLWMQDKFGDQICFITYNSKASNKPDLIIWVCTFHMILEYYMVLNRTPLPQWRKLKPLKISDELAQVQDAHDIHIWFKVKLRQLHQKRSQLMHSHLYLHQILG